MKKIFILLTMVLFLSSLLLAAGQQEGDVYPGRNINVTVHSSAGGGSDTWARKVSALMEKELGVKFIVNNMSGANGTTAANSVWNAPHDGYTLIGASESSMTYAVSGGFDDGARAWHYFWSGGSPGVIVVSKNSPYKDFKSFADAARSNSGQMSIAISGIGKLWHLKAEMVDRYANVPMKDIPYSGSAPAITALLSGEVDALSCSTGEAAPYIQSGDMIPLVITEDYNYSFEGYPTVVPAITDLYPEVQKYLPMSQGLCLLAPKDIPEDAYKSLGAAFDKVMDSSEMLGFMQQENAVKIGMWGPEADKRAVEMEARFSWFAQDLGVAQVSPEKFGIARP